MANDKCLPEMSPVPEKALCTQQLHQGSLGTEQYNPCPSVAPSPAKYTHTDTHVGMADGAPSFHEKAEICHLGGNAERKRGWGYLLLSGLVLSCRVAEGGRPRNTSSAASVVLQSTGRKLSWDQHQEQALPLPGAGIHIMALWQKPQQLQGDSSAGSKAGESKVAGCKPGRVGR